MNPTKTGDELRCSGREASKPKDLNRIAKI
jgi:hypothetical protein